MRTILVLIFSVALSASAFGQRRWGGNMLDPKNEIKPNRPPDVICKDGSLDWEIIGRKVCGAHKGVKQFVHNQYLGLDEHSANGVKILTVAAPPMGPAPEEPKIPEFWARPIEVELTAKGGHNHINAAASGITLIKLKKY